jgi:FkbM family methyltransferase
MPSTYRWGNSARHPTETPTAELHCLVRSRHSPLHAFDFGIDCRQTARCTTFASRSYVSTWLGVRTSAARGHTPTSTSEHYDRHVLVSYAQNREDLYLYALLGDGPGFYVDVGANHPQTHSVTKFFAERGWRGINIEPNVHLASLLEADRPDDLTLNIGLADRVGTMSFRLFTHAPGLSTFDEGVKARHAAGGMEYVDIEVPVSTLAAVFQQHPVDTVDFLKVDVEGFEMAVLRGNDWTSVRPRVVVLEGGDQSTWSPYLTDRAYSQEFFDGLNFYFVAEEHRPDITIFKYAERVLSDAAIPFFAAELLRDREREIESSRLTDPSTPMSPADDRYPHTDAGIWRRAAAAASRFRR